MSIEEHTKMSDSRFSFGGQPTDAVEVQDLTLADPYLELRLLHEGMLELRLPFIEPSIDLAIQAPSIFSKEAAWLATLDQSGVLFRGPEGETQRVSVGSSMVLGNTTIWLLDTRAPAVGRLEGVTPPFTGRVWPLLSQQAWVGRAGKRLNHIEIDHPTISRAHAAFIPEAGGQISLLKESGSATTVNGTNIASGQTARLKSGDLVGFGGLLFRFISETAPSAEGSLLSLKTLGTFEVNLGKSDKSANIRSKKAQWLLAILGVEWGNARSVDSIIDLLWPEVNTLRGRKNLSHLLAQLRDGLEMDEEGFDSLIQRTTSSLQLNTNRLGNHDYISLKDLTSSREALTSMAAVNRLFELNQGPFLSSCYDEWAETIRHSLEIDVTETMLATARVALDKAEYRLMEVVLERLLQMDPLNEDAIYLLMKGELQRDYPEKAREAYQELCKALEEEGLEPSDKLRELAEQLTPPGL